MPIMPRDTLSRFLAAQAIRDNDHDPCELAPPEYGIERDLRTVSPGHATRVASDYISAVLLGRAR